MPQQHQPVARLRARVGDFTITEEDHALQSVPPFVVLNGRATEVQRFKTLEAAREYAAQLMRRAQ